MELGDCEVAKFHFIRKIFQYETNNIIFIFFAMPDNGLVAEIHL